MTSFPWADSPPDPVPFSILIPPPGVHRFTLLGLGRGIWLHWVGKRSLPCLDQDCPRSRHIKPAYWLAYLPALHWAGWDPYSSRFNLTAVVVPLSTEKLHGLRKKHRTVRGVWFETVRG